MNSFPTVKKFADKAREIKRRNEDTLQRQWDAIKKMLDEKKQKKKLMYSKI
jgi:hypothetical protein